MTFLTKQIRDRKGQPVRCYAVSEFFVQCDIQAVVEKSRAGKSEAILRSRGLPITSEWSKALALAASSSETATEENRLLLIGAEVLQGTVALHSPQICPQKVSVIVEL